MTYVVKTAQTHFENPVTDRDTLLEHWIESARTLAEKLEDSDSVNQRALTLLPELTGSAGLKECREFVAGVTKIGEQLLISKNLDKLAADLKESLTALETALKGVTGTGLTTSPNDSESGPTPDAWWMYLDELFKAAGRIKEIALELTPMTAHLKHCGTIVGQIYGASVDPGDLLLLLDDNVIVAIAAVGDATTSIQVRDLVVSPQYIRHGGKGAGGALMEHIARKAQGAKVGVTLLALNKAATDVYLKWGFVSAGSTSMSLHGAALERFVKTHTVFEPS